MNERGKKRSCKEERRKNEKGKKEEWVRNERRKGKNERKMKDMLGGGVMTGEKGLYLNFFEKAFSSNCLAYTF